MKNTEKSTRRTKSKKVLTKQIKIVLLLLVIIAVAAYFFYNYTYVKNSGPNSTESTVYKGGPGGDSEKVTEYHTQAVAAWKQGNKEQAKELAKKGLAENEKLTIDQQSSIKNQTGIVFDMFDITKGTYKAE